MTVPFYFRYGIPVFIVRVPYRERTLASNVETELSVKFSKGLSPALVFRRLDAIEVAFRETALRFSVFTYTPIMPGLIRLVPEEGTACVIGWANWFTVFFAVAFLWLADLDWFFVFALCGVLGVIYLVQARRYRKVARQLVEAKGPAV